MAKMTLDDLKKLRESTRRELAMRSPDDKDTDIIVSMGTSGIAAGAKETLKAFVDELNQHSLTNVAVRQVGGMGLDHAEPTVEGSFTRYAEGNLRIGDAGGRPPDRPSPRHG